MTIASLFSFFAGGSGICWAVQLVLPWFGKDDPASLVFMVAWLPASLYLGYRFAGWFHAFASAPVASGSAEDVGSGAPRGG